MVKNLIISDIIETLGKTNSVKEKELCLLEHKDNDNLKNLLSYTLNPYKLYHLNKIPDYIPNPSGITSFKKFFQLCDNLSQKVYVGNEAKNKVKDFLETCLDRDARIFEKVISKSALGVGAKTVNKVWENLIPEFSLMLAPNKIADVTKVPYPCAVQPKLDGYRCVYKGGQLWSRAGKPFANKNLVTYFKCLEKVDNFVLDGELYLHGISFNNLTKILNSENTELPKNLKYHIYDCVREDYWDEQKETPTYEARLTKVRELVNDYIADYSRVIDTATDVCTNPGEVLEVYKNYLKKGYEGVMIKGMNGSYRWKRVSLRTAEMLKLKPFHTLDLEIKGVYEGEGSFVGMAGGVVVDNSGVSVRIGTGFDVVTRKAMAQSPNDYIGKVVEVRYFEKTEEGSLRHPSFVRFREEKD